MLLNKPWRWLFLFSLLSRADRLVEDFEGHVHVLAREDERGRPADGVVARAEDDEAAPITFELDAVAQVGRGRERLAVGDELDADHHAEAAHVAHALVLRGEAAQALLQV